MEPYWSERFFNPSSPYAPAVAVRRDYEAAKRRLANLIGAQPGELVMTAGATESINIAFSSVAGHVAIPAIEHDSVLRAAERHEHTVISVDSSGLVTPEAVVKAIRPDTTLVSVALANHELGTIQPLSDIAGVIAEERRRRMVVGDKTPIYLHSDASQAAGLLDLKVSRLGVDMLTLNAAKIYGPKQVGLLWSDRAIRLSPIIVGGGQERGVRGGTENVAGVIGFAEALQLAADHRPAENRRLTALRDELQRRLSVEFPGAVVSGSLKHRLASHLHISFPGLDAERLVFRLENDGVLVATGSACAANKGTRSHVLTAIGLEPETADGSLRLTLGRDSTEQSVLRAGELIIAAIKSEMAGRA